MLDSNPYSYFHLRPGRRDCLRLGAMALACYLFPGIPYLNGQDEPAAEPVLGVQLYSFRNQMKQDVSGTLAQVKRMGFTRDGRLLGRASGARPCQVAEEI
jgi:hypothetical protein